MADLALTTGRDRIALDYARQAAKQRPDDLSAQVLVVKALIRLRDLAGADFTLQTLLKQYPNSPDVQVQLGMLRTATGDEKTARAAFNSALKVNPDSIDADAGLVALELNLGRLVQARERVEQTLVKHPDDLGLLQLAGRIYRAEGNLQRAETTLRHALDIEPGNVVVALSLVECLSLENRRDDAMRMLEGLLQRQPSSIAAQTAMGVLLEQLGRTDEARARYEKIISENPGAGTAAAHLALLYVDRKDNLDVALAFMTEAKRSAASDPDVSDALGWVYLNKNLVTFAVPHLEDAVRGHPRSALFQYHLGMAYIRGGQPAKARQALTRASVLDRTLADQRGVADTLAKLPR